MSIVTLFSTIAPITTIFAAIMTASNLGARITGLGFVIFTLSSILWTVIGVSSDQTSLIVANGFLTIVNIIGIWRWLGRQRIYEEAGKAAQKESQKAPTPTLLPISTLSGLPVRTSTGKELGKVVEALLEEGNARLHYVVVASHSFVGLDEVLRPIPLAKMTLDSEAITVDIPEHDFEAIPEIKKGEWPKFLRS